ncbi:unnamed protein product, partial [Didymodactylos carnosus]
MRMINMFLLYFGLLARIYTGCGDPFTTYANGISEGGQEDPSDTCYKQVYT